MIIVQATDGLGNQLFQYAIGRQLSILNKTELLIDTSHFINFTHRKFSLHNFKTNFQEVTNYKKLALRYPLSVLKLKAGYFSKLNEKQGQKADSVKFSKNSFLRGYWQNEAYFKSIRNVLLEEIQIKGGTNKEFEYFKNKIENSHSVSIHVRRGDLLLEKNKNIFALLKMQYYQQAIELVASKVSTPTFFIFSDDIEWARSNFAFLKNSIFIESKGGLKDFEELILMNYCKHSIIANSTFSWWAAWLNTNPNKLVIQPKLAYSDAKMQKAYDLGDLLYCKDFIRI